MGRGQDSYGTGVPPGAEGSGKRLDPRVAMFCDNTRDAIKGHVFDALQPGFVNGGEGLEREILRGFGLV